MHRGDHLHLSRMIAGFLLVATIVLAWAHLSGEPAPDASVPLGYETDSGTVVLGTLEAEAIDTAYSEPTPAPTECRQKLGAYRDTVAIMRARLSQYGDHRWKEPTGVGR